MYVQAGAIISNLGETPEEVVRITDCSFGESTIWRMSWRDGCRRSGRCPVQMIQHAAAVPWSGTRHGVVRVLRGVTYINDSKGTNVDATIKALESLPSPVILIAGGREKGEEYPVSRKPYAARSSRPFSSGKHACASARFSRVPLR